MRRDSGPRSGKRSPFGPRARHFVQRKVITDLLKAGPVVVPGGGLEDGERLEVAMRDLLDMTPAFQWTTVESG